MTIVATAKCTVMPTIVGVASINVFPPAMYPLPPIILSTSRYICGLNTISVAKPAIIAEYHF